MKFGAWIKMLLTLESALESHLSWSSLEPRVDFLDTFVDCLYKMLIIMPRLTFEDDLDS